MRRVVPLTVRTLIRHVNRRAGKALLRRLPARLTCFETTVTYRGIRLNVSTGESIGRLIYYFNDYESALLDAFASLLRPGTVVFDVGANIGLYSLVAASKGAVAWAFEPSSELGRILKGNIDINGFSSRVFPVQEAVSDKEAMAAFYEGRADNMGVGRIFRYGDGSPRTASCVVQANCLDWYSRAFAKPDIVKMDIEGAELWALRGAKELLARDDSPVIFIELHPGEIEHLGGTVRECVEGIMSFGYRKYDVRGCRQASHQWHCFSKTDMDSARFAQDDS